MIYLLTLNIFKFQPLNFYSSSYFTSILYIYTYKLYVDIVYMYNIILIKSRHNKHQSIFECAHILYSLLYIFFHSSLSLSSFSLYTSPSTSPLSPPTRFPFVFYSLKCFNSCPLISLSKKIASIFNSSTVFFCN